MSAKVTSLDSFQPRLLALSQLWPHVAVTREKVSGYITLLEASKARKTQRDRAHFTGICIFDVSPRSLGNPIGQDSRCIQIAADVPERDHDSLLPRVPARRLDFRIDTRFNIPLIHV